MSTSLQLKKMPGVNVKEVLQYIQKVGFFERIIEYAIDWRRASIKYNLMKWYKVNGELTEVAKIKLNSYKNLSSNTAKAKAALKFVIDNLTYIGDRAVWKVEEYWQTPIETWNKKTGDCEDGAILLDACLDYLGVPTYQHYIVAGEVLGGGHCYVVYVSDDNLLEYPLDWCYWTNRSIIYLNGDNDYFERNEYYNGSKEWFRFNKEGAWKRII